MGLDNKLWRRVSSDAMVKKPEVIYTERRPATLAKVGDKGNSRSFIILLRAI